MASASKHAAGPAAAGLSADVLARSAALGVTQVRPLYPTTSASAHPGPRTFVVAIPPGMTAAQLQARYAALDWVEYVEPDWQFELHAVPNDPLWPRQWDLENTGQPYYSVRGVAGDSNDVRIERTGYPGADIRFRAPYESGEPTADVLVAIIDTGLDTAHVDLHDRLAPNAGEIRANGLDDDHNGFVDDIYGWDFSGDTPGAPINIRGDNDIRDYMGHGTHVAGTVAAAVDNAIGIAGVCPQARVIGAKIFPNPYFSISAAAIYYAVDRGARVINMSWGGAFPSRAIEEALQYAADRGVTLVASMGNSGRDEVFYPSGYATTIGVGSSDARDRLSRFSTYNDFVDVIAPGEDILSLRAAGTDLYADVGEPDVHVVDGDYLIASGTSMAAPHVTGAAATLLALAPGLSSQRLREILRAGADDIIDPFGNDSLHLPGPDRHTGAGRINLQRAMAMLPGIVLEVVNPPRGYWLSSTDFRVSVRAAGPHFGGFTAMLARNHPPFTSVWREIPPADIRFQNGLYEITLRDAADSVGPHTLRLDAGPDAAVDWPLWLGAVTVASILAPLPNDTIRLLRPIIGTAAGPSLQSYSLFAEGPLPSRDVHAVPTVTALRWNDTLAYWRTDSLESGEYDLILSVNGGDATVADTVRVFVHEPFLDGFPVDLPAPAHFAVTTVNLDGRDGDEIICPTQSGLYVLRSDGRIYPGWPRATNFDVTTAPAVADLDGDGKSEIIVASRSYMHVYSFIGEPFAGWPRIFLGGSGIFGNSLPVVGDVDGVGGREVAGIDRHGRIKIWHADGTIYAPRGGEYFARIPIVNTLNAALPRLAVCDLNGDRRPELVAAGDGVFVFDALTGGPMAGNDDVLLADHHSTHGLAIGDYDGDGDFDIAYVAADHATDRFRLAVIDSHGDPLPGWPQIMPEQVNLYLQYSLSAGDLDGDHRPELLLAPYTLGGGMLYAFHGNGAPVGSDSTNGLLARLPGTVSAIVLANVDRDIDPEIVMRVGDFISGPDYVYALEADGALLPGYPLKFGDGNSVTMPAPIIGDVNADGLADMTTIQSTSMSVAVWELGVPFAVAGRPWPRFAGDLWNSNIAPAPRYDLLYLVRLIDMTMRNGMPLPPHEPVDLDCDGSVSTADIVALIDYLYRGGAHPCRP
ncbi:MAG TPA: S8 family serine peptidase [bacterium]|nr:S8 family serine peptidase [bacterium]